MKLKFYKKYFFILILINIKIFYAEIKKENTLFDSVINAMIYLKDIIKPRFLDIKNDSQFTINALYKNYLNNDTPIVQKRQDNIINFFKHYFTGFASPLQQKTLWEFVNESVARVFGLKFLKFKGRFNNITLGFNIFSIFSGIVFGYAHNENKNDNLNHISMLFYLSTILPYINPSAFMPNISKLTSFILNSVNKKKIIRDYLLAFITEKLRKQLETDQSYYKDTDFIFKLQNFGISLALSTAFDNIIMPLNGDHYYGNENILLAKDQQPLANKQKIN